MEMTHHADIRQQQRSIPDMVVDLLLQFGVSQPSGDGTNKYFFDKLSRRRLQKYAGSLASVIEPHLNVYAVVGEGQRVITVAHRIKRIPNH